MADERIDELRQQLKSLGYLDAGVDRFVLGAASGQRGAVAVAVRSSVRVGLLGAVVLGPAAVIGLGARVPGLVSGVRDALVLALYLGIVFFAAVTAAALATSLAAAAVGGGRRAGTLVSAAGWVVTLGTLAYLTFWWRNASAGLGWQAPGLTASVLALAVLISLLLGHAVRIATLGTIAARGRVDATLPRVHRASWPVAAGGGALAFAGAALLLVVTTAADSTPAVAPPLTVVSRGVTVRVIAVDGVDPRLVDEREWAPEWARGYRYALDYGDSLDPVRTWTTVATGEPPEVHGLHAMEGRRVAGIRGVLSSNTSATGRILQQATDLIRLSRPSIASRDERKVMTFWEVADAAGLRSSVVNWWATWPAFSRNGVVASDRAVLRLERGGTLDAEISPSAAYAELLQRWPQISNDALALAQGSFAGVTDRDVAAVLIRSATLDASVLAIDAALAQPHQDLDVVYLPGLDIAQHALLGDQGTAATAPSVLTARLAALRSYHHFLGILIRPRIQPVNKQATILVTAPGRIGSGAAGHLTMFHRIESLPGVALAPGMEQKEEGPRFEESTDRAHPVDLAPTILNLLGVPISRDLPGKALRSFAPNPERFVSTYGRPAQERTVRAGTPLDQETIDRLRSLGYIK